jgi:hypothetical protein
MSSDPASGGVTTGGEGEARREGQPEAPLRPGRCNPLLISFLSFWLIGFGVWVVSAGKRYREEYAQGTEGWRVGSSPTVQLTLVREDKHNLACASDQVIAGLHCAYRRDLQEAGPGAPDNPQILQPYNTVGSELLLGAGLWTASDLKKPLPATRFTVLCSYHIEGVAKSSLIRFDPAGPFVPAGKTVTVGTLTDCTLSQ